MSAPLELQPACRVAVTAAGVISPLGADMAQSTRTLRDARDCVTPVEAFDVSRCRCKTAGQVDDAALEQAADGRREKRLHRASRMMISAARELLRADPGFAPDLWVIGTTSGGMSYGEAFFRALRSGGSRRLRSRWTANYSPQKPVLDAMEAVGMRLPSQIIANACASGTNAIGHAFSLVRAGRCQRVLCGGYDALSELVFAGFDCLQASTSDKCRPFDRNRTGLVLGEGAALLALEEMHAAQRRGAPILGEVIGYGISTDNHHLTQPHPSGRGPLEAMEAAVRSAGIEPGMVDYINAHGTATAFNDATEGAAIAALFGRRPLSSTKSMMGHSLGAAGAIEAVISLVALREGFMPANIHFEAADPQWEPDIVANRPRAGALQRVISNSFGFGGTNASVILQRAHESRG